MDGSHTYSSWAFLLQCSSVLDWKWRGSRECSWIMNFGWFLCLIRMVMWLKHPTTLDLRLQIYLIRVCSVPFTAGTDQVSARWRQCVAPTSSSDLHLMLHVHSISDALRMHADNISQTGRFKHSHVSKWWCKISDAGLSAFHNNTVRQPPT